MCTRSVTLKFRDLPNHTIRLKHGGVVAVDGMDIQPPLVNGQLIQDLIRISGCTSVFKANSYACVCFFLCKCRTAESPEHCVVVCEGELWR